MTDQPYLKWPLFRRSSLAGFGGSVTLQAHAVNDADSFKGFLQEMVARGLRELLLIVTDGNPGVLNAIEEVGQKSPISDLGARMSGSSFRTLFTLVLTARFS